MPAYHEYLIHMPDGTIKQINPLTGTEVWSVPGRSARPLGNGHQAKTEAVKRKEPEDYCDFCVVNVHQTPPEKARMVISEQGEYEIKQRLSATECLETDWQFRRVSNLFEILRLDYWRENFGYKLNEDLVNWKNSYFNDDNGHAHVISVVNYKLQMLGKSADEIGALTEEEKLQYAEHFFGGTHELIIANRHYISSDSEQAEELYAISDMNPEQHYQYWRFTINAIEDIYRHNRYVRYVTVFQNWLHAAGASFEHLHRQLVGLDEWGTSLEWEIARLRQNPNIYNELLVNFAAHTNRVVAENEHAVAFVAIGHRFPTLAVYSKSKNLRPHEMSSEEIRGMSDLVHAMHTAIGKHVSCNEEWYYTPRDSLDTVPWHVLIKLRVNTLAGFEGGTRIYINPYAPYELRDMVVPSLYSLRYAQKVNVRSIAEECAVKPNSLRYNS